MKYLLLTVLVISVKSAPYMPILGQMTNQQLDQAMMDQIVQQSMERWILQDQYNSMQQQLMAMQQLQTLKKTLYSPMQALYNLPQQPLIILMPNTVGKTTNRLENEKEELKLNLGIGDAGDVDTVVVNAENEANIPGRNIFPQRAVVQLPNGQRLIIGSIISAIPFLPFEVNVPDTIGWIYNGIAGIIGGIGQRLPFRPKPTTESPIQQNQESMPAAQEPIQQVQGSIIIPQETGMSMQESRWELMQKVKKQNVGMPILMLPLGHRMPIQVPIQV